MINQNTNTQTEEFSNEFAESLAPVDNHRSNSLQNDLRDKMEQFFSSYLTGNVMSNTLQLFSIELMLDPENQLHNDLSQALSDAIEKVPVDATFGIKTQTLYKITQIAKQVIKEESDISEAYDYDLAMKSYNAFVESLRGLHREPGELAADTRPEQARLMFDKLFRLKPDPELR